ncbi:MAG: hypothetical protein JSR37_04210 [Verrucomicrobia bacterium]|nr:hypothetical protein [Verrucomicrobiota bacterium]MBS0636533.1 hypothetical protein [Verrucomicrobiota bacterium]
MFKRVMLALICLVATACGPRYADFFPYFDNGTKKPSFTMLPVYNETKSPYVQDFPLDLSKAVRNRLKRTGKTYSPPLSQMQRDLGSMSVKELGEAKDLKVFNRFKGTDFVVVIETAECAVSPYTRGEFKTLYSADIDQSRAKVLTIGMRLEIINLKGAEPRAARMELVKTHHMVSEDMLERAAKGDTRALEMIRSRIAQDLAKKIEETVCTKK